MTSTKVDLKEVQDALTVIMGYAMRSDRLQRNADIRRVVGDYMAEYGCFQKIVKGKPKRTWLRFLGVGV